MANVTEEEQAALADYARRISAGEKPGPKTIAWMQQTATRMGTDYDSLMQQTRDDAKGGFLFQRGEIDTPGERIGADIGKAIGSGATRAAAGLAGLPGAIINTGADALDFLGVRERPEGERAFGIPEAMRKADEIAQSIDADAPSTSYDPQTRAGKYAQTVSEFMTGAGLTGFAGLGTQGAIRKGVVAPAMLSETGGQIFEDTPYEPIARVTGALAPSVAAGVKNYATRAPQERIDAVRRLQSQGVEPTAGMALDSPKLRYAEDATEAGRAATDAALDQYTQATINRAVPGTIRAAAKITPQSTTQQQFDELLTAAGKTMDDLASRNNITTGPHSKLAADAQRVASQYNKVVTSGNKTNFFKDLADELANQSVISGPDYQRYRSELSALTKDTNSANRDAAQKMLALVQDAMDASIRQKGNVTDLQLYRDARSAYRNLMTLEPALAQVPGRSLNAQITPSSLASATRQTGRRQYVRGKSVFDDLIRDGTELKISQMPSSGTAERMMSQLGGMALPGAAGGGIGAVLGGSTGGALGALFGAALPPTRNAILSGKHMQDMLKKNMSAHAARTLPGAIAPKTVPAIPGILPIFDN